MEKNTNIIPWNLIIGRLKHELTEDESDRFKQWSAAPGNAALFEEIEILWTNILNHCSTYTPDKEYYWKKLSQHIEASRKEKPVPVLDRRQNSRRFYQYIAVACAALLMGMSFYIGSSIYQPEPFSQEYASLGGKSKIILPDGSQVWLNAHSSLSYGSDFLKDRRVVKLSGEACFDVVHKEYLPFVVKAGGVDIKVHGTKFDVESFDEDDSVQVSLLQGAVSMQSKHESRSLKPGERGVYYKKNGTMTVAGADVDFTMSWAQDKLEFNHRPLGDICRFLSKWYRVKIIVHPSLAGQYNYTFTLRNEPLEEILRLMSRIHPLACQFDENNVLHLTPLQDKK